MIRVLSLGAGVQSSTLALMAAHGEIEMPDCAIFADTQAEPKSVYEWLDWLETKLPFPVYRVSKGNLANNALIVRTSKANNKYSRSAPPAWITEGNGKINNLMRQCTVDYKITPIIQKLRALDGKKQKVEQYIGISLDESIRMKPNRETWIINRWPLIEKRMSRQHCLQWMQNHEYPQPPRSSCYFCPYHNDNEWIKLKNNDNEAFNLAVKFEKNLQHTMSQIKGFRGKPFLHRSCIPLNEIDFTKNDNQLDIFSDFRDECEGMCGI